MVSQSMAIVYGRREEAKGGDIQLSLVYSDNPTVAGLHMGFFFPRSGKLLQIQTHCFVYGMHVLTLFYRESENTAMMV